MNKKETKAIRKYNLKSPGQVVLMANVLKKYVIDNNLFTPITTTNKRTGIKTTKDYVMVEGWQFAGGLLGFSPHIEEVKNLTPEGTENFKWFVKASIIRNRDEKVVGCGFALCSKEEPKKKYFDEYAILSMAQTRAIGKAFRNKIGWVMKLAGYESTPQEEMPKGEKVAKEDIFEVAKKMIKATRDTSILFNLVENLKTSKKYTKDQKKELNVLISKKVDEINSNK